MNCQEQQRKSYVTMNVDVKCIFKKTAKFCMHTKKKGRGTTDGKEEFKLGDVSYSSCRDNDANSRSIHDVQLTVKAHSSPENFLFSYLPGFWEYYCTLLS